MKPVILVNLGGVLVSSTPFEKAHEEWFNLMGTLINDDSISEHAESPHYFEKIPAIMKNYLGNIPNGSYTYYARVLYSLLTIREVKPSHCYSDFALFLRSLKENYTLILITTVPQQLAQDVIAKCGCVDIFDAVAGIGLDSQPNSKGILEAYISNQGSPAYYIGNSESALAFCQEKGICGIAPTWDGPFEGSADHIISEHTELQQILGD